MRNEVTGVRELSKLIALAVETIKRPLYIKGYPGVAKTSAVHQYGERKGYAVLEYRFGLAASYEVGGINVPNREDKTVERYMPELIAAIWRLHRETAKPVLVFLDEMDKAGKMLQTCAMEFTLERTIAGYAVPEGTEIVLAGNTASDGSGSNAMSTALMNRVVSVEFAGPTVGEWTRFQDPAAPVGWYVQQNPEALTPGKNPRGFNSRRDNNTTPRSLSIASDIVASDCDPSLMSVMLHGALDPEAADEIMGYVELAPKLYTLEEIVNGEAKPFKGDDRLALSGMQSRGLARQMKAFTKDATDEAEVNRYIVGAVSYITDVMAAEVNMVALQDFMLNGLSQTDDRPNTRIVSAFNRVKADLTAFEALRDRATRTILDQ